MRLLIVIVLSIACSNSFSQFELNTGENRTCESAYQVCGSLKQIITESATGEQCNSSIPPFYYSFYFPGNNAASLTVQPAYPHTGQFVFYGPFNSLDFDICNLINTNSAPYVSGAFEIFGGTSTPQTMGNQEGFYILKVTLDQCIGISGGIAGVNIGITLNSPVACDTDFPCGNCITSFAPSPGKYIVSAWTKEKNPPAGIASYTYPSIEISFTGSPALYSLLPEGQIIDGWQRIEEVIEIPPTATGMDLTLLMASGIGYFDDIRFFPFDGNMMSYVYDPVSLRLMAELDERNYATLYEYDEEGKLIRVKKETERGVMTIQENRDNITKQ